MEKNIQKTRRYSGSFQPRRVRSKGIKATALSDIYHLEGVKVEGTVERGSSLIRRSVKNDGGTYDTYAIGNLNDLDPSLVSQVEKCFATSRGDRVYLYNTEKINNENTRVQCDSDTKKLSLVGNTTNQIYSSVDYGLKRKK